MKNLTLNYEELISQTDELRLQVDSLMNDIDTYQQEDGISTEDEVSYLAQRWLLDEVVTMLYQAHTKLYNAQKEMNNRLFPKKRKK